ncbi:putative metallophosphoesterase [Mesomycoplasma dispar]|uniref:Metallophosphatase n=1 Tax=Mesomycoplasma dispar TaxID=86660 RepID=A0AAJ5NLC2_9BACT|nr:TIGR00282 family metallophosphoesterase [Mesomycoplasma dispar]AJR12167.1 metallophosphatase [Mesomycoplasma dispar]ATP59644.1 metallophosphatase [Mesomycoplasma dispar]VEU61702.1 putative metallophosphoesterase [Mesomycoplasma dispar]
MKSATVLFVGDIFGTPGIKMFKEQLEILRQKYTFDLIIVQAENITGRKGLNKKDYLYLKELGVDIFTIGNHVWSNPEINLIIDNPDIVRPLNIDKEYQGKGSTVIEKNGISYRITSLLGVAFNKLVKPWNHQFANDFFDAIDQVIINDDADFHIVDFHAETTSEKNTLAIYLNGKINALLGTHTHVQTADARQLSLGTLFITDVGMTGPGNDAIGVRFLDVYNKIRYNKSTKFHISQNEWQFNAVILELSQNLKKQKIIPINLYK